MRAFAFDGYQFTWDRSRGSPDWVEEKLHKILVNDAWMDIFGGARAASLEVAHRNHLPLILKSIPTIRIRARKRFKFENFWLKDSQCREVVNYSWDSSRGLNLLTRIDLCGNAIWKWGNKSMMNFQPSIELCKCQMEILINRRDSQGINAFIEAQR